MILIFGGTTEGRLAAEVSDKAGKVFYYSTLGAPGRMALANGREINGPMDAAVMADFCRRNDIRLIIDAAHPFATNLHEAVTDAAALTGLPAIRVERVYEPRREDVIWCDGWDDALAKLMERAPRRLLALTGVKTIGRLKPFWSGRQGVMFRILDRPESRRMAAEQGVDSRDIIFYHPDADERELFERLRPDAIITKESGASGGFGAKVEAALKLGIEVFAVKRPPLPQGYAETVTGRHGLRRAIERLLPGYFDLRGGFTTGACATAAVAAAMRMALQGRAEATAGFELPDGEWLEMPVESVAMIGPGRATAATVKDMSDDPDVTRGCRVVATVELTGGDDITFRGGEGIGVVTLPGTGLAVGEPAINKMPRAMMERAIRRQYPRGGVTVTICIPDGAELAKRTFNPRIGIEGGLSVIGTSGIVTPFSHAAFVDAMRKEMDVAKATGCGRISLNSGARSERAVRQMLPGLPPAAFIHYGNAVGDALRLAVETGFDRITLSMMIGKAVKLAAGQLDTHSRVSGMDMGLILALALESGADDGALLRIESINMASELWDILPPRVMKKFSALVVDRCMEVCRPLVRKSLLEIILLPPVK